MRITGDRTVGENRLRSLPVLLPGAGCPVEAHRVRCDDDFALQFELFSAPQFHSVPFLLQAADVFLVAPVEEGDCGGAVRQRFAVFQNALAAAMSVYDNEQATEEEVAAAEEDLQAALDQLRAAVGDTEDPDNSGSDGNTGNGGSSADTSDKDNASAQTDTTKNNSAQKSVKTGDTAAPIVGAAAAMMLAVAAGVIAYRRRRETR